MNQLPKESVIYEVEILTELEQGYEVYYYPSVSKLGGGDGLIVKIIPKVDKAWIGVFEFGTSGETGLSNVFRIPNSPKLCVVANGAGYIVSSLDKTYCLSVNAVPIKDVRISEKEGTVIFADFTDLIAYDDQGIKWCTERIALDGFTISSISDTVITGEYYDPRSDDIEFFTVDLSSGDIKRVPSEERN